jgi:hydrogenase expression/formation protein HypC
MCLAVPGRILEMHRSGPSLLARVEFGGIVREAVLDFVPEAQVGDYVLVHVGFAISVIDSGEAEHRLDLLKEMSLLGDARPSASPKAAETRGESEP